MTSFRSLLCFAATVLLPFIGSVSGFAAQPTNPEASAVGYDSSHQRIFVSTPAKDREIVSLVEDYMTPRDKMHVLYPHTSCDEAIMMFLNNRISGAPVVDPKTGNLMGVVSSSDFMLKDFSGAVINMEGSSKEALAKSVELANKITGTTVEELMSPNVLTISKTDCMSTAADHMKRLNLHRLLVVDGDDKNLIGILTEADVIRDVLTTARAALPAEGTHDDDEEDMSGLQP